jgi:hypothetical protein
MLIFAWAEPDDPQGLRLSLFAIDSRSPMATKFDPQVLQETTVDGRYALWVEGPYVLELTDRNYVTSSRGALWFGRRTGSPTAWRPVSRSKRPSGSPSPFDPWNLEPPGGVIRVNHGRKENWTCLFASNYW